MHGNLCEGCKKERGFFRSRAQSARNNIINVVLIIVALVSVISTIVILIGHGNGLPLTHAWMWIILSLITCLSATSALAWVSEWGWPNLNEHELWEVIELDGEPHVHYQGPYRENDNRRVMSSVGPFEISEMGLWIESNVFPTRAKVFAFDAMNRKVLELPWAMTVHDPFGRIDFVDSRGQKLVWTLQSKWKLPWLLNLIRQFSSVDECVASLEEDNRCLHKENVTSVAGQKFYESELVALRIRVAAARTLLEQHRRNRKGTKEMGDVRRLVDYALELAPTSNSQQLWNDGDGLLSQVAGELELKSYQPRLNLEKDISNEALRGQGI